MRHVFFVVLPLVAAVAAAQTSSPALLVLEKKDNALAIIDPLARKVVGRVPTGDAPHEVTASSDGKRAFVANYGGRNPGSTISVIDLQHQKELRRVDLGVLRRPHGISFAGQKVYFTAELNKLIARYDPDADQLDWLLGTGQNGTHMLVLGKNTNQIFTANIGSNSVSAIEQVSGPLGWEETTISVGQGPEGIDLSPDGKEVWVAHSRDGGISIIDVASKKRSQILDIHTRRSNRLKFTPDGKLVLVSDVEGGELIVLDVPTRKQIERIRLGNMPEGILITPNGARAYVAVAGDNEVISIDLKSLKIADHIKTGSGPDGMAWVEGR